MKKVRLGLIITFTILLAAVCVNYIGLFAERDEVIRASLSTTENLITGNSENEWKFYQTDDFITAEYAIVYDIETNEILYLKGSADTKIYPASIPKLFSAFVALQYLDVDTVIQAGNEIDYVKNGSSLANIEKGQKLTVESLIYGMLLPSGNDAAYVIAVAAGRTISGNLRISSDEAVSVFVNEMNRQAKILGMTNTNFINPDGFHDDNHYTSLIDIVIAAKVVLNNSIISNCVKTQNVDIVYTSGETRQWENTNLLIDPTSEYYCEDAIGMKTGYTLEAGNCLLSAFKNKNSTYVIGTFNCDDTNSRFEDAKKLYEIICK